MINRNTHYDVIVIGSGPAGSTAVKELTERGLDVLLLEAGRDISEADFEPGPKAPSGTANMGIQSRVNDAMRGQPVQSRRAVFAPGVSRFLVNDRENPYATAPGSRFLWIRGRQLGGRVHAYGRVLLRLSDFDFKGKSLDGEGADWPISYADLAPYYDRVEDFVGVYGNRDGVRTVPDGHYAQAAKLSKAEEKFKATVESTWPERRVITWRYAAPNLQRVPLGILAARKTGRLTTRTDAVVQQITVDDRTGKATGAVFVDRRDKTRHTVHGDIVVLCASTIESIRILLNSQSTKHPDGLGNSSGLLGRYFMDQTPSLTLARVPEFWGYEEEDSAPHDPYYAPAGGVFVPRYVNVGETRTSAFVRGFSFQGVCGRIPVAPDEASISGLMGFGEMLPHLDNRVTVHPSRHDDWGIPIPVIRCVMGDNDDRLLRAQVRAIGEMFEANDYQIMSSASPLGPDSKHLQPDRTPLSRIALGAAIHECGGVRMGVDPATSLLNEHNQSWDVPNLFVTDGSAFASSGSVGPTLTIMALSARAAAYIAEQHADGAL